MKKALLLFLCAGLIYSEGKSQNTCTTCHDGANWAAVAGNKSAQATTGNRVGNGNNTLGTTPSYIMQNVCGLNYITESVETTTRETSNPGTGFPATMTLPSCLGTPVQAYLYWGVSYWEASPPNYTVTITNPQPNTSTYTPTLIGTGPPKCWGEVGTAAYRADVTASIALGGTYTVTITGPSTSSDDKEIDGMTLVYVYNSGGPYSGSIALWDGNYIEATFGNLQETFSGFSVCAATANSSAFGAFGDMQANVAATHTELFNGSTGTFPNSFWNTDIVNTSVTNGQNTVTFDTYNNNSGDCYSWILAGLYWQNTTCQVCTSSLIHLVMNFTDPTCGNNNGTATVHASGPPGPYTYLWSPAGGSDSTATGLSSGTYTVRVITGCDTSYDSVPLIGNHLSLTPNFGNIKCNGQTNGFAAIHVSGGTSPYNYLWTPTGNTTDSIGGLSAGTYTLVVTDMNGCPGRDSITITQPTALVPAVGSDAVLCNGGSTGKAGGGATGGTPPYTYNWSNGASGDSAKNLSAGTYTLTVTDSNNCSATIPITVNQPTPLIVTASGPSTICAGQSGTLKATVNGGTAPYAYNWSNGSTIDSTVITPTSTATYTINVTDANGCTAFSVITVTLGSTMVVAVQSPAPVCEGGSVTLCATISGGTGGGTYSWQPGNLTGACITVSPSSTTVYTVSVTDNCGSSVTAAANVVINPLPEVSFSADNNQGCSPLCIQFRDHTTLTSGKAIAWSWRFGNGDSLESENPIYCYPNSGKYSVDLTVTSDSGCSSTLKILNMITVYTHPAASFKISPQPAEIINPTIQFTDYSTDAYGIAYWFWNFGDGIDSNSNVKDPSHTYQDTGTYCAREVVMNLHGCTDTVTNCLVIDPVFCFYIPDAFSPNGNGKNEVFEAKGQYVKDFQMYIFDRWGMELFHSNDINNGWNGTVNGGSAICQEDSYIYKILVTDPKNKVHSYVGTVSLLK